MMNIQSLLPQTTKPHPLKYFSKEEKIATQLSGLFNLKILLASSLQRYLQNKTNLKPRIFLGMAILIHNLKKFETYFDKQAKALVSDQSPGSFRDFRNSANYYSLQMLKKANFFFDNNANYCMQLFHINQRPSAAFRKNNDIRLVLKIIHQFAGITTKRIIKLNA